MIVFDLKCGAGAHIFEAWFASSAGFEDQKARGLIACPFCGDTDIAKAVMAPNVSAKGNQTTGPVPETPVMSAPPTVEAATEMKAMIAKIATLQAESLKSSLWVGKDFERQARAMDAGEVDHASIHGQATPERAKAMVEDGIGVMPLLVPVVPPEQQN